MRPAYKHTNYIHSSCGASHPRPFAVCRRFDCVLRFDSALCAALGCRFGERCRRFADPTGRRASCVCVVQMCVHIPVWPTTAHDHAANAMGWDAAVWFSHLASWRHAHARARTPRKSHKSLHLIAADFSNWQPRVLMMSCDGSSSSSRIDVMCGAMMCDATCDASCNARSHAARL